jgi:hypothetical protein
VVPVKEHVPQSISEEPAAEPVAEPAVVSQVEEPEKSAPAQIFFPELIHDFGKVPVKSKLDYCFSFSNAGNQPLEIKNIYKSCGCTATTLGKKVLDPDESSEIKVVWDVGRKPGKQRRIITIFSNDPDHPKTKLTVTAEVQSPASTTQKTASKTTQTNQTASPTESQPRLPPNYILRPRRHSQ